MSEWIRKAVIDRLNAVHMHVEPCVAVEGLTDEEAQMAPFEGGRSPKEFLYHIVFWQDFEYDMLRGIVHEVKKGSDWDVGSVSWDDLVERFNTGLDGLLAIAANWDMDKEIKITEKVSTSVGAALLGISQHTSYHLGQLVTTRKALGKWSTGK
jgi:hypothetical protein